LQKARFDAGEKRLNYGGLCKQLTQWRSQSETSWLKDAPTHPLQQALKDLERAYTNFFAKRTHLPRFKKKGQHESFRYPDPKQIKLDPMNSRLFLPKLGWLRYRNSRSVLGRVKNVTVSLSCGKWLVSIQTEREVAQPLPRGGAVARWASTWAWSALPRSRTAPSTPRSAASSDTRPGCAKRSKP
jgi:putative transposase